MPGIKYAQIGVGHAHANKIAVYRASTDYEVVGVAEPNAALRRKAENLPAYQGLRWLTVEQLLNEQGVEVVGVETEVGELLNTAEKCIEAGLHVHLDKPAGESLPQFQRLLDKAARKHLAVQLGYMYRYNPAVMLLREFLQKGWLGEPFEVVAVMSKFIPSAARKPLAQFAGGIMFELGCHLVDLVLGVLGPPKKVHAFPRHSSPLQDGLIDNALAVLEYPRATATIRSTANEVDGFERRHLTACGSRGTFHVQPLDAPTATFTLDQAQGKYRKGYQEIKFGRYSRYEADAADLAKIIRGEKPADFSYDFDYHVQKTLLEASGLPTR